MAGIYLLAAAAVTVYAGARRLTTPATDGSENQPARRPA
jgi:hypothetical protein